MRIKRMAYAMSLGMVGASPLMAQQTATESTPAVQRIEVTGSSIKRLAVETALPLTILTRDEIDKSGVTSAYELLGKVSANVSSYASAEGVGDSTQGGFAGASLRGLGANSTLVLLNGRRVANYAFNGASVDLNAIPIAAVEMVEVLKDGASAIYGTDAIGGVINFILRKNYQGADIVLSKEDTERGGAEATRFALSGGYGSLPTQGFNLMAAFSYDDAAPLNASQRDFAKTGIRPDLGVSRTSGNAFPANFSDSANPDSPYMNLLAAQGCLPSSGSYQVSGSGAPDPLRNNCRYDFSSVLDIAPQSRTQNFVTRAVFALGESHEAYAEYTLSQNKFIYASSETPIANFSSEVDANGVPLFQYPVGGKYYPSSVRLPDGTVYTPTGALDLGWRGREAGRRTNVVESEAERYLLGLKGSLASWEYDVALNHAISRASDRYVDGWLSKSALDAAIKTGDINPFGTAQDATGLALLNSAKILQEVRRSKGQTTSVDGKLSGEWGKLAGGAIGLASGVEFRREKWDDNPAPVLSSGDVLGGGGNQPNSSAQREVYALYGEMLLPLLKTLEAQLQLRHDRYSDFGSTTNPKIGMRWTPMRPLLLRAAFNTGFRAPSLPDLFQPAYIGNTANTFDDPLRCPGGSAVPGVPVNEGLECEAQLQAQFGGNPELQPEKSKQWSFGIVLEPARGFSAAFDVFAIERKNTITAIGDTTIFGDYEKYAERYVVRRPADNNVGVPGPIQYVILRPENLGTYKQSGLDIGLRGLVPWQQFGRIGFGLEGSYLWQYKFQRDKGGAYVDNLGRYTTENGAISRWRHTLSVDYELGPWRAAMQQNFVRGYLDEGGGREVGNVETYDLQAAWLGIKGLTLSAGVRNLFDRDPPISMQGRTFQVGYDPRYGDPRGRLFYGRLNYAFR